MKKKSPDNRMDRKSFLQRLSMGGRDHELDPDTRRALKGARQLPDPATDLESILTRLDRKVARRAGESGAPGKVRWITYGISVAATVCLLFLAGKWWVDQQPAQVAYQQFEPLPIALGAEGVIRSYPSNYSSVRNALFHYESGDYAGALPLFENALDSFNKDSSFLNLYYGISLLAERKASRAIDPLAKVKINQRETQALRRAARWYLALAYLASGDQPGCQRELDTLLMQEGDFNAEALELRDELGSR